MLKPKVFIAHANEDSDRAKKLFDDLVLAGCDPWIDSQKLLPGQDWKMEIESAIQRSDVVLACLSQRSVSKSGFVQREFRIALSKYGEKPPGSIFLIPVLFDDCAIPDITIHSIGVRFADLQWVRLIDHTSMKRLVDSIFFSLRTRAEQRAPIAADKATKPIRSSPTDSRQLPGTRIEVYFFETTDLSDSDSPGYEIRYPFEISHLDSDRQLVRVDRYSIYVKVSPELIEYWGLDPMNPASEMPRRLFEFVTDYVRRGVKDKNLKPFEELNLNLSNTNITRPRIGIIPKGSKWLGLWSGEGPAMLMPLPGPLPPSLKYGIRPKE